MAGFQNESERTLARKPVSDPPEKGLEHPSQIKIRLGKLISWFRFPDLWYEASLSTRAGFPRLHLGNVGLLNFERS